MTPKSLSVLGHTFRLMNWPLERFLTSEQIKTNQGWQFSRIFSQDSFQRAEIIAMAAVPSI